MYLKSPTPQQTHDNGFFRLGLLTGIRESARQRNRLKKNSKYQIRHIKKQQPRGDATCCGSGRRKALIKKDVKQQREI